ncbi:MAG: cytochrome C oxidase subunit IV family protein [Bacteroidota bacterium]
MSAHDLSKEVKKYILVFVGLMILTFVTVYVSSLEVGIITGIIIAMAIAATKGTLVASFFMHLLHEKKIIFWLLIFTAIFLTGLLLLPILVKMNGVRY